MRLKIDAAAEQARQTASDPVFEWIEVALDWLEEDPVNGRARELPYADHVWAIEAIFATVGVWVLLWEVDTDDDGEHAHVLYIGELGSQQAPRVAQVSPPRTGTALHAPPAAAGDLAGVQ